MCQIAAEKGITIRWQRLSVDQVASDGVVYYGLARDFLRRTHEQILSRCKFACRQVWCQCSSGTSADGCPRRNSPRGLLRNSSWNAMSPWWRLHHVSMSELGNTRLISDLRLSEERYRGLPQGVRAANC